MPQILDKADVLAAKHHQVILMADFRLHKYSGTAIDDLSDTSWDEKAQQRFVDWLKKELPDIHFEKVFLPHGKGWLIFPYLGHIAIIVSEVNQPEAYRRIVTYWENEDGTPRFADTRLYFVPPAGRTPKKGQKKGNDTV